MKYIFIIFLFTSTILFGQGNGASCSDLESFEALYQKYKRVNPDTLVQLLQLMPKVVQCQKSDLLYRRSRLLLDIDTLSKSQKRAEFSSLSKELAANNFEEEALMLNFRQLSLYKSPSERTLQDSLYNWILENSSQDSVQQTILCYATFNYANYLNKQYLYSLTSQLYNKSLNIAKDLGATKMICLNNMQLGYISRQIQDIPKAIDYAKEAINHMDESVSSTNRFICNTNLSHWYYDLQEIDSSMLYLERAMKIKPNHVNIDIGKSRIFMAKNQLDSAMIYLEKSIEKNTKKSELDNLYGKKGLIYEKQKNKNKARYFFGLALANLDSTEADYNNYRKYAEGYLRNDPQLTAENDSALTTLVTYFNKVVETNTENQVTKAQIEYETLKKESQLRDLTQIHKTTEAELKARNIMIIASGVALALLSLLLRQQWNQRRLLNLKNERILLLSQEISHRTKNQIALIANIITNQKQLVGVLTPKELIQDLDSKVRALAEVNRNFESDEEQAKVDLKVICESILENNIYSLTDDKIELRIIGDAMPIDASKASQIALVINELSTNSMKYAFTHIASPIIEIHLSTINGQHQINYFDNGRPTDISTLKQGKGSELIKGIIHYLDGSIESSFSELGFKMTINIPTNEK